jgi:hypothetical protein
VTEPVGPSYADLQAQIAAQTQANTRAILAAGLTRGAQLTAIGPLAANAMVAGAAKATALADVSVAALLAYHVGRGVPTVGLGLTRDRAATIALGVKTIVESGMPSPLEHLDRLARAVPLEAGQVAYQDAAEAQGVEQWVRVTDAKPCPLCKRLADGKPIAMSKRMVAHPGCACTMRLLLPGEFVPATPPTPGQRVVGSGLGRQITRTIAPGIQATVPAPSQLRRLR